MKVTTPEISWHAKEAIYSIDVQPRKSSSEIVRIVTAGIDSNIRIWQLNTKEDGKSSVRFLSNLSRHEKPVNITRFSNSGNILASGGDDATIILWKLSDKEDAPNIFDDDEGKNVESWNATKIMRGHLEDVTDLCWSSDDLWMVSGSIDYTAIAWNVEKGQKIAIFSDAKHFIHGVSYDPLSEYAAVMSCDRSLRIYNLSYKKCVRNISRMVYPPVENDANTDAASTKSQRLFHDETVVRRRLTFTPDGKLLIVPAGCLNIPDGNEMKQINTVYIFSRNQISQPAAYLSGINEPATVSSVCPMPFALRNKDAAISLPYRWVFAVATSDTILIYDTEQCVPCVKLVNLHYASITDLSWDTEGRYLLATSRDGFCSIIYFNENELGKKYNLSVEEIRENYSAKSKKTVNNSNNENKLKQACSDNINLTKNVKEKSENIKDKSNINIKSKLPQFQNNEAQEFIQNDSKGDSEKTSSSNNSEMEVLNEEEKMDVDSVICISDDSRQSEHAQQRDKNENTLLRSPETSSKNEVAKRRILLTPVSVPQPEASPKRRIPLTTVTDKNATPPSTKHLSSKKEIATIHSMNGLQKTPTSDKTNNKTVKTTKPRRVGFTTLKQTESEK